MEESEIQFLSSSKANDKFINAEALHQEDIDSIAQEVVDEFFRTREAKADNNRVIISILEAELALDAKVNFDSDIFEGILRIRKAVVETLDKNPKFEYFREVADWDAIIGNILQGYGARSSLGILKSGSILKKVLLSGTEKDEKHREALDKLYTMPERSEFLAYPIREVVRTEANEKYEVQKYLNMKTLQNFTDLPPEKKPPLSKLLKYILDSLKGLHFLLNNGFVLSDFRPSNIGVNLDTDSGMLFDYDSLYPKDYQAPYNAHPRWIPSEVVSWHTPVDYEEPLMMFEFGKTILALIGDELPELKQFAEKMTAPRYGKTPRPSLDEVVAELNKYIQ